MEMHRLRSLLILYCSIMLRYNLYKLLDRLIVCKDSLFMLQ
jgi:hypothetical protein